MRPASYLAQEWVDALDEPTNTASERIPTCPGHFRCACQSSQAALFVQGQLIVLPTTNAQTQTQGRQHEVTSTVHPCCAALVPCAWECNMHNPVGSGNPGEMRAWRSCSGQWHDAGRTGSGLARRRPSNAGELLCRTCPDRCLRGDRNLVAGV